MKKYEWIMHARMTECERFKFLPLPEQSVRLSLRLTRQAAKRLKIQLEFYLMHSTDPEVDLRFRSDKEGAGEIGKGIELIGSIDSHEIDRFPEDAAFENVEEGIEGAL